MKRFFFLPAISILLLFCGCSHKELSREKAFDLIKKAYNYPEVWDYPIFTADPEEVKKLSDAGLENQGFVTIEHHQRLMDVGKPLIQLTGKSSSYVLPSEANDAESKIVRVKAGEIDIVEVTGVKMLSNGKGAVAEYTTAFKNLTPFAPLRGMNSNKDKTKKAYFSLYDDGWRVEKKPGIEFLSN